MEGLRGVFQKGVQQDSQQLWEKSHFARWNRHNAAAGAVAGLRDASTPLGKAVRILNNQLQALMSIDERADALEARLDQLASSPPDGVPA